MQQRPSADDLAGAGGAVGRSASTGTTGTANTAATTATASFSLPGRPYLKSRAYSAPLSAHHHISHLTDPGLSSDEDDDLDDPLDELSHELDIAADPFFQQCDFLSSAIVTENGPGGRLELTASFPALAGDPNQMSTLSTCSTDEDEDEDDDDDDDDEKDDEKDDDNDNEGRARRDDSQVGAGNRHHNITTHPGSDHPPHLTRQAPFRSSWAYESSDSLSSYASAHGGRNDDGYRPCRAGEGYGPCQAVETFDCRPESSDGRVSPKSRPGRPDSRTTGLSSNRFSRFTDQYWSPNDVTVAVIGERGVGKSTFIQRAFGLRNFSAQPAVTKKKTVNGECYNIRLVEVAMATYDVDDHDRIIWPDLADGQAMPPVQGVFVLYDVMHKRSLDDIPDLLIALHRSGIQFMLIASKCDCHPALREIDPETIRTRAQDLLKSDVISHVTAISWPDTYQKSLEVLIKLAAPSYQGLHNHSFVDPASAFYPGRVPSRRRVASTTAGLAPISTTMAACASTSTSSRGLTRPEPEGGMTPTTPAAQSTAALREQSFLNLEDSPGRESASPAVQPAMDGRPSLGLEIFTDGDIAFGSAVNTAQQEALKASSKLNLPPFPTFDQLVDHLLELPLGRGDEKFRYVFLCLYRFIAAPSTLLDAVLSRFEALEAADAPSATVESDSSHLLLRSISQQRYISVLQAWLSQFPGDFAHPLTRNRLADFLTRISDPSTDLGCFHMVSAQMLIADLDAVLEDDDTDWACSDSQIMALKTVELSTGVSEKTPPVLDRKSSSLSSISTASPIDSLAKQSSSASLASLGSGRHNPALTSIQEQRKLPGRSGSSASFTLPLAIPRFNLGKSHWCMFMDTPEDVLAAEFTNIDWQLFSAIRPRDIIRHVSMSSREKEIVRAMRLSVASSSDGFIRPISISTPTSSSWLTHRGLLAVDLLTSHFNHVAMLISNIILLRDKLRYRVIALTKVMKLARVIRTLNNYHALGAVLAGLNSAAIHRLGHTREHVNRDIGRDYMKLEILMASSRSHAAYRLAWENTDKERIPYLPLHRRDLVAGLEGSRTWSDELSSFLGRPSTDAGSMPDDASVATSRSSAPSKDASGWVSGVPGGRWINWRKFEIIGDIVLTLSWAQEVPYQPTAADPRSEDIQALILEGKVRSEEELYQRSCVLEPVGHTPVSGLGSISLGLGGLGFGSMNNGTAGPTSAQPAHNPSIPLLPTPNAETATKKFHWFRSGGSS